MMNELMETLKQNKIEVENLQLKHNEVLINGYTENNHLYLIEKVYLKYMNTTKW